MSKNLYCCLLLFAIACQTEDISPLHMQSGTQYFPLEVGQYSVFEVVDIQYRFNQPPDTVTYQLKEIVADSFPGQGGEILYSLERYSRRLSEDLWQLDSTWTARKNSSRVIVTENNVPYIKLVFPLKARLQWDGNALNTRPEEIYSLQPTHSWLLEEIHSPLDSLLGSSLTVMQKQSQDTIILYTQKLETYVEGIGLFYKKSVNLQYCASEPACIGLGLIESGWHFRQTLIGHGKESP